MGQCQPAKALIYELCGEGDLYDSIHQGSREAPALRTRVQALRDVARALAFLHDQHRIGPRGTDVRHVIHRDVKSANILLCGGTAKLGDVGLARVRTWPAAESSSRPEDLEYQVPGTPGFMDPHYVHDGLRRFTNGDVPLTDIYALGITVLEAVTPNTQSRTESTYFERLPIGAAPLRRRRPRNLPLSGGLRPPWAAVRRLLGSYRTRAGPAPSKRLCRTSSERG